MSARSCSNPLADKAVRAPVQGFKAREFISGNSLPIGWGEGGVRGDSEINFGKQNNAGRGIDIEDNQCRRRLFRHTQSVVIFCLACFKSAHLHIFQALRLADFTVSIFPTVVRTLFALVMPQPSRFLVQAKR